MGIGAPLILSDHSVLAGTSTVQIVLSTIYVALGLRLLMEGFVNTQGVPQGAFLYFINPAQKTQVVSKAVYFTNVRIQNFCTLIYSTCITDDCGRLHSYMAYVYGVGEEHLCLHPTYHDSVQLHGCVISFSFIH